MADNVIRFPRRSVALFTPRERMILAVGPKIAGLRHKAQVQRYGALAIERLVGGWTVSLSWSAPFDVKASEWKLFGPFATHGQALEVAVYVASELGIKGPGDHGGDAA